jgi:hypothetical protein
VFFAQQQRNASGKGRLQANLSMDVRVFSHASAIAGGRHFLWLPHCSSSGLTWL